MCGITANESHCVNAHTSHWQLFTPCVKDETTLAFNFKWSPRTCSTGSPTKVIGGVSGHERRLSEVELIFEIFGIIQAIGNDVIIIINHRYQVVEGLREELSQARVSNNQLLEALEVTDQLISSEATIQKLSISFFACSIMN